MAGRQGAADIIDYGLAVAVIKPNGYNSEDHFLCEAFKWTWNTFPDFRRTFFHPANERKVITKGDMIKLKQDEAKGMLPGVSDIVFLSPVFTTELKQPGKKQTVDQIKFQAACEKHGIPYYLVEYMEDFQSIVKSYFE